MWNAVPFRSSFASSRPGVFALNSESFAGTTMHVTRGRTWASVVLWQYQQTPLPLHSLTFGSTKSPRNFMSSLPSFQWISAVSWFLAVIEPRPVTAPTGSRSLFFTLLLF